MVQNKKLRSGKAAKDHREKADKLDYVLFPSRHLEATGIEVRATPGQTPDEQVNVLHRHLAHLSAAQVLALTTRVWHDNLGVDRIDQRSVVQLVAAAVGRKRAILEKLRPQLREDVRICLGEKPGGPRTAK